MDSTTDDTEEERGRSSGAIKIMFKGIKQLDGIQRYSAVTHIRHLPWQLMVKTSDITANGETTKGFSVFLCCKYKPKSTSWSCNASADLTLVAQSATGHNTTRKIEHKFCVKENDWGFQNFLSYQDVLNPEKGFIKGNTIFVEAMITAEEPIGVFMPSNVENFIQSKDVKSYPELAYFMNESMSDVVFKVEGKPIPALKELLSVKCDYFRSMFSGNYTESDAKEIEIPDTTCNAFKVILWYLYSQELVIDLTEEKCFEFMYSVYRLADRFQIKRLLDYYENQLKANITEENLELVSRIGFDYKIDSLMTCVKAFIDKTFDKLVLKDGDYLTKMNALTNDYLFQKMIPKVRKRARIDAELPESP